MQVPIPAQLTLGAQRVELLLAGLTAQQQFDGSIGIALSKSQGHRLHLLTGRWQGTPHCVTFPAGAYLELTLALDRLGDGWRERRIRQG
jgi:hypothetical protein